MRRIFSCNTTESSEQFSRQYKHLQGLLDELSGVKFRRLTKHEDG